MHNEKIIVKYGFLLIAAIYISFFLGFKSWEYNIVGAGDAAGYYMYLPMTIIHRTPYEYEENLNVRKKYLKNKIPPPEASLITSEGRFINQYTMGVALLNAPPFMLAHLLAHAGISTPDGYSSVYRILIHLYSLSLTFIGLFLIFKTLRRFFNDKISLITIIIIGLGTNLFYIAVLNGGMAHSYLFFLHALLIYFSFKIKDKYSNLKASIIGIICGLICLIRPNEVISIFIPIVIAWDTIKEKKTLVNAFLFAGVSMILPILPQLIYWKTGTGNWLYYSYGSQGFNFLNPSILKGLFSFSNGWLVYTPVMSFALVGIIVLFRQYRIMGLWITVILLSNMYVIYSWWCWNYINGFGSRPMVDYYPMLAIPFAAFLQNISSLKVIKFLLYSMISFFILLNIFQTLQVYRGVLFTEDSNYGMYASSLAKLNLDREILLARDVNQWPLPKEDSFNLITMQKPLTEEKEENNTALKGFSKSGSETEFGHGIEINYQGPEIKANHSIRISGTFFTDSPPASQYEMAKLVFEVRSPDGQSKIWKGIKIQDKINDKESYNFFGGKTDEFRKLEFDFKLNETINTGDKLKIYLWNPHKTKVYSKDLAIYSAVN